jgi:hypothetical protein
MVEKLGFTTAETLPKPAFGSLIQNGESIEEGDAVFGEGI